MQLGQGTTFAVNGPMMIGGNFILQGNITIPKDSILTESKTPTASAQSQPNSPARDVSHQAPQL
jgi:hypothetical protein